MAVFSFVVFGPQKMKFKCNLCFLKILPCSQDISVVQHGFIAGVRNSCSHRLPSQQNLTWFPNTCFPQISPRLSTAAKCSVLQIAFHFLSPLRTHNPIGFHFKPPCTCHRNLVLLWQPFDQIQYFSIWKVIDEWSAESKTATYYEQARKAIRTMSLGCTPRKLKSHFFLGGLLCKSSYSQVSSGRRSVITQR